MQIFINYKYKILLLFLFLFGGLEASSVKLKTIQPKVLSVGIDLTYAPYAYMEDGKPSGFDTDLMKIIAEKLGLKVQFKDTRIENIIIGLNSNHYDLVASALYINPQRAKQVDFLPYLQTGGVLVVRKGDSYQSQTVYDLCGKKVSSMKGASWIPALNAISESYCKPKGFQAIEIKEFPSAPEAAQALLSFAVDVQYEDAAVAKMVMDQQGNRLEISSKKMIDPVIIGLAFNKKNKELRIQIAQVLDSLVQSGEYEKLLKKYNLAYPNQELLQKNAAYIASNNPEDTEDHSSHFNWTYLWSLLFKKEFYQASVTVILLSALTWLFSVIFGFFLALAYQSDKFILRKSAQIYVWFFRSLPLLILLIFIYNLPQIWPSSSYILANPFVTGLIALVLSESAYIAEIHRGALLGIPKGQFEAAKALGIRYAGIQRLIIMPQALRIALPALANQYVTIIKLTSLVSVISLTEILLVGQQLYTRNFLVIETLIAVAFYYVLIISAVTWALKQLEKYLDISKKIHNTTEEDKKKEENNIISFPSQQVGIQKINKEAEFALEVKHVFKDYGNTPVLKDINLSVKWGEVISIIGPSGSGKTSLIRSINGLETLNSGEIWLEGEPFLYGMQNKTKNNPKEYSKKIVHIGMVFQGFNLFPHKTVLENVMLAPLYHKYDLKETIESAMRILEMVGLKTHIHKYPHQLSGGQQQRVAIARSLVMKPSIVLFDEPTSALDPELVNDVLNVIEGLAKEGMTMIIVTHEMKFALKISKRIIYMEKGQVVYDTTSKGILEIQDERLKHYFYQKFEDYVI